MTATIAFTARGNPVAQGSVRAFVKDGKAVVVGVSSPLADWRHAIATEARAAMTGPALTGPVVVSAWFTFARPPSHFRRDGTVRPAAARYPRLDLDKLSRALLDAISGGVCIADDSQVIVLHAHKAYDASQGVEVRIREEEA